VVFLVIVLVSEPVSAEAEDRGRWIPSLGLGFSGEYQTLSGSIESTLRPSASEDRDYAAWIPEVVLGLESPVLFEGYAAPRVFVYGGWQFGWQIFEDQRYVAKEGNPKTPNCPDVQPQADECTGQGSRVNAEVDEAWSVGAGLTFEIPIQEWVLRITPGAEFRQQWISVDSNVVSVESGTLLVQEVKLGNRTRAFESIGPRLGIELEVLQDGPVSIGILFDGTLRFSIGDDKEVYPATSNDGSSTARLRTDSLMGSAGVGVVFRWTGD
jgi:hypothetical protein